RRTLVCGRGNGREKNSSQRNQAIPACPSYEQDQGRTRERARDAVSRRRLHVGARFQTPALRFAGTTLVLQSGYGNSSAANVVSGRERRREIFAGRQAPRLRAQAQSLCPSSLGRGR